jgi:hypothetical protein
MFKHQQQPAAFKAGVPRDQDITLAPKLGV